MNREEFDTLMEDLEAALEEVKEYLSERDYLDCHKLYTLLENLESARDAFDDQEEELSESQITQLEKFCEGEIDDLVSIMSDLEYGAHNHETLIREDDFEEYVRQLAYDIGAIDSKAGWPTNHIDWESAAEELKMDYTAITIIDDDYYFRNI